MPADYVPWAFHGPLAYGRGKRPRADVPRQGKRLPASTLEGARPTRTFGRWHGACRETHVARRGTGKAKRMPDGLLAWRLLLATCTSNTGGGRRAGSPGGRRGRGAGSPMGRGGPGRGAGPGGGGSAPAGGPVCANGFAPGRVLRRGIPASGRGSRCALLVVEHVKQRKESKKRANARVILDANLPPDQKAGRVASDGNTGPPPSHRFPFPPLVVPTPVPPPSICVCLSACFCHQTPFPDT